ncbi:hypothetical protein MED121_13530 [Marinomonas sp. MED121]|nr:hypothetical protein MED121_13530 [Marinomonas sp. MED121]
MDGELMRLRDSGALANKAKLFKMFRRDIGGLILGMYLSFTLRKMKFDVYSSVILVYSKYLA